MMKTGRRWLRAVPLVLAVVAAEAVALEGALQDTAYEDTSIGYSIRSPRGWESLPRKNPDDPTAGTIVGGWYSKREADLGARLEIHAFGTFFPPETRAVATGISTVPTPTDGEPAKEPPPDGGEEPGKGEGEGAGEGEPGKGEGGAGEGGESGEGGDPGAEPTDEEKRPAGPTTAEEYFGANPKSLQEWIERVTKNLSRGGRSRITLTPSDAAKFGSDDGSFWEGRFTEGGRAVATILGANVRRGEFEVAALYFCAPDEAYLKRMRSALRTSLKSLRILSRADMERAQNELQRKMDKAGGGEAAWLEQVKDRIPPGWKYRRTANYLIVYDKSLDSPPPVGHPRLVAIVEKQLEAIRRDVYEEVFPAEKPIDAISVVKITQDPDQYAAYGAPGGSAGYWSWPAKELVFFYDKTRGDLTLDVLNHEAFHQYIFYSVGQVSPHSWFNEGHGDYFAGYSLREGKFKQAKFDRRTDKIRGAIEGRTYVPLVEFLKFSQAQYYQRGGEPRKGGDVLQNYAQGWSLVWFLRTTKDPKYAGVLERYFDTLKVAVREWREAEDALATKEKRRPLPTFLFPEELNEAAKQRALEAAFGALDIAVLERDWIESKPY
jgi:hypothetical protein